jgi:hypothetical protein
VRDNWHALQEVLHTRGVLGQRIPVWPVAIVCTLANFSLYALAYLFAIAVVFVVFHVLNDIIYVVPAEMERTLQGDGCDEQTHDLQKEYTTGAGCAPVCDLVMPDLLARPTVARGTG